MQGLSAAKPGKSNLMKKLSLTLFSLLALAGGAARASQPLAFDFMVTGSDILRPILVFHDGENTYIQPPDNILPSAITVKSAEAAQYGPYLMVKGVPKSFTLNLKKEQVSITYTGKALENPTADHATASAAPIATAMRAPQVARVGQPLSTSATQAPAAVTAAVNVTPERGAVATAGKPACEKRVARSESAYVVGFDFPPGGLPPSSLGKLRLATSPHDNIESIFISLPPTTDSTTSMRSKSLDAALVSMGISEKKIHSDFKGKTDLGAELRIVRASIVPCAAEGVRIDAPHSGSVTVLGTADAKQILEELAAKLGVAFRAEGDPVPLPVSITETEVPLVTVLQKIGNAMSKQAIVVSRPNELLIRYRTHP